MSDTSSTLYPMQTLLSDEVIVVVEKETMGQAEFGLERQVKPVEFNNSIACWLEWSITYGVGCTK